jgi:hypothetical protein
MTSSREPPLQSANMDWIPLMFLAFFGSIGLCALLTICNAYLQEMRKKQTPEGTYEPPPGQREIKVGMI